jgi:hypothetical protein
MRTTIASLIVMSACVAGFAQQPAPDTALHDDASSEHAAHERRMTLNLESAIGSQLPWMDQAKLLHLSERQQRAELWNAPLGRLYYNMASQQAMLGREGFVNGGQPLGLGMTTLALGDARHRGVQLLLDGTPWGALPPGQGLRASFGIASAIAMAIVAAGG